MAVKQILVGKAGSSATPLTLIKGDSNTQIIEMIVDRYYGGVDLEGLAWSVTAENAEGASDEYKAIKASISDAGVIIQWKVTGTATAAVGITKFKLSGYTQDGDNVLIWQSGDYFIRINDTFEHIPGAETQAALTEVHKLIVYVDGALNGVINAGKDAEAAAIAANKAADRANSVADGKNEGRITALEQFTTKPGEPYSVSGSMVRLDNFEGMPMNVVTHIEPVQSGSGDPYPAGGGKNLLKNTATTQTVNGVTFTVNADGTITANGTTTERAQLKVGEVDLPAGDYIVSKGFLTTNNDFAYLVYLVDGAAEYINVADEELAFTFTESTNLSYFVDIRDAGVTANNLKYYPMIRLASITDSTYAPYSNIRPISGHGGAKLTRYGKNLANTTLVQGARGMDGVLYTGTGFKTVATYKLIPVKPGMTLYVNTSNGSFTNSFRYYFYDFSETLLTTAITGYNSGIPVPSNAAYFAFHYGSDNYANYIGAHAMVADGEFATYEPYQGDTFSADFGQTVYGGTLDWNTGVLTVEKKCISFDGSEGWVVYTGNNNEYNYGCVIVDKTQERLKLTSSHYTNYTDTYVWDCNTGISELSGSKSIRIYDKNYNTSDVSLWKTYLAEQYTAGTPVQVCYELETPTTIQLTPQDIHALQGENNIWSSAGETTVSGRRDVLWLTGHLIDKIRTLEEAIVSMGGNV